MSKNKLPRDTTNIPSYTIIDDINYEEMQLTNKKPLSTHMQGIVNKELTPEQINTIGRKHGFGNSYARELFRGNVNISDNNKDLIIEVCKEAIKYRCGYFPVDV